MKNIYKILLAGAFLFAGTTLLAQSADLGDCEKTCTVEKTIGEGVFLGVRITNCGCDKETDESQKEVRVVQVIEGTNAEKMGIKKDDRIFAINGVPMTDTKFMVSWIGAKEKGYDVTVQLRRDGKEMALKGELGFREERVVTETICCDENIGKFKVSNFKVYPNPSSGEFTLDFDIDNERPFELSIADLSGNVFFQNEIAGNGKHINENIVLPRIPAGEYVILLNQEGKIFRDKLVIVR